MSTIQVKPTEYINIYFKLLYFPLETFMKYVVEINQQTLIDKHIHKHTSFLHEQYNFLKVKRNL